MTGDQPKNDYLEPSNDAWRREQSRARRATANPLEDSKTTAPAETPRGLSPREAARMWGTGGFANDGIRRRYLYSKT
jgi:hypothetical protein